jgi:hypothetical protein
VHSQPVDQRIPVSMRQIAALEPVTATLLGTLISALRNAVNFVTSIACALAPKMTSLLCSCTVVARK